MDKLKIISWNASGIQTKVEKDNVMQVLIQYDIVCLIEVKTGLPVMIPGYVSCRSAMVGTPERGVVVCEILYCSPSTKC